MSLRGLLRHQLAIITPATADITDLDEAGFPNESATPSVVLVPGLVQPRDSHEVREPLNEGLMGTQYLIFLEVQPLSGASYIVEADDDGPIEGARRFQIDGIQPFLYGSSPHLEVYATLMSGSFSVGALVLGS
jgi:hypothetical protein